MSLGKISIVTVTVQPVVDIEKTADSLLSQIDSAIRFEWIVVVGEYYDDYKNFLQRFADKIEIKVLFQSPQGIYAAMNFGLSNSSGDWIWFVNCGDYLKSPHVISALGKIISDNPKVELIASPVLYVTPQDYWFDVSSPRIIQSESRFQAHAHHQGVLVRRSICDKIDGGFDTSLKFAADGKFLDQAINLAEYLIVDSIFCVFVMGGASAKNYVKTVRETLTYRKNEKMKFSSVAKNWFRQGVLFLLEREGFSLLIHPFVQKRSKTVENALWKSIESKSPNKH